jgi:hypothetical protein
MDPNAMAGAAASFLMPYLVKFGKNLAEDAVEKLPEHVQKLWALIQSKVSGKPAAEGAAQELVEKPDDPDNQEAFILQLKKLLKEDPAFTANLEGLLKALSESGLGAEKGVVNLGSGAVATGGSTAAGAGGIAIGGSVGGSIIMGSNNTINPGGK